MELSRRYAGFARTLLAAAACACGNPHLARLSQPVVAQRPSSVVMVRQLNVPDGFVRDGRYWGNQMVIEVEVDNRGPADLPLAPSAVALRLSGPAEGDEVRWLPMTAWGAGPIRFWGRREPNPSQILLRAGERNVIWVEFNGFFAVDPLPQKLVLRLALRDGPAELVLADPARNRPRWQLPPRDRSGFLSMENDLTFGLGVLVMGEKESALTLTMLGFDLTAGPVVVHQGIHLVLYPGSQNVPSGFGFGSDGRLFLPVPSRFPGTGPREFWGPYLGARVQVVRFWADEWGGYERQMLFGPEIGLEFRNNRHRPSGAPFPLVRADSPLGDSDFRIGYMHWFGHGRSRWGVPGLSLGLGFTAF